MTTEPLAAEQEASRPAESAATASGQAASSWSADAKCFAALALLWVVMALLAKPIGDFPINDDWVYGLSVKALLETGRFSLPSPASVNLLPQAYWGALFCLPFGFSFTALRLSTLVLGLVGVWATFATARELGAERRIALLGAALIAVNPVYFALANTFMTDVPSYAVSVASLYFLVRWTRHLHRRDALIGLALSMVAILIRQAGIVLPAGFALAYIAVRGLNPRAIVIASTPVLVGALAHFGFQAWLHSTGATPAPGEPPAMNTVLANLSKPPLVPARLLIFLAYAGLFLLPVLAVVGKRAWLASDRRWQRTIGLLFFVSFAVCAVGLIALGKPMPLLDNVLNDFGGGPLTLTDTYFYGRNFPVVPPWLSTVWLLLTPAALIGGALLVCVLVHGIRIVKDRSPKSGLRAMILVGGCAVSYTVLAALGLRFFYDRYVLFLFLAAVLFLSIVAGASPAAGASRGSNVLLALVVLVEVAFTTVATRDHLEWNRARWTATAELLAGGVSRTSIDGGYEFNGWLGYNAAYQAKPGKSPWWVVDDEYMIASGPMAGYSVHRTYPFRRLLTGQNSAILVLHRNPK